MMNDMKQAVLTDLTSKDNKYACAYYFRKPEN